MKIAAFVSCIAAAAVAQTPARITVNFPSNSGSEYTVRAPVNLPACKSATWNIGGNTYDGVTSCSVNATAKISVIPFRCYTYSQKANAQGINDCDKCYYGWGRKTAGKIDPFLSEAEAAAANEPFSMYFVPQNVTSLNNLRSCLMVSDKNLATLCDRVVRSALSPTGSTATCVKGTKVTPFAKPLGDSDRCAKYGLVGGKIACL